MRDHLGRALVLGFGGMRDGVGGGFLAALAVRGCEAGPGWRMVMVMRMEMEMEMEMGMEMEMKRRQEAGG